MSFLGLASRKFFDNLQHKSTTLSRFNLRLPCPPYHSPDFWDRTYKDMEPGDVHEWGGFDLNDLMNFRYEKVDYSHLLAGKGADASVEHGDSSGSNSGESSSGKDQPSDSSIQQSSLAQWMDISQYSSPEEASQIYVQNRNNYNYIANNPPNDINNNNNNNNNINESILLLGCGNSKLGEQFIIHSFLGPIIQIDISSKVIQLMNRRYEKYFKEAPIKRMEYLVDDAASGLTSLEPGCIGGCVLDKGLVDVLHRSLGRMDMRDDNFDGLDGGREKSDGGTFQINKPNEGYDDDMTIRNIMKSVHRVLQPSRPFIFFSQSSPEFILRRTLGKSMKCREGMWKDINVVNLVDYNMLMYKFVKISDEERKELDNNKENDKKKTVVISPKKYKRKAGRR